jgi:hypothetical protein
MRPFDDNDWTYLAGAEPFSDGSPPLVSDEVKVGEMSCIIVADRNGVEVIVGSSNYRVEVDEWMAVTMAEIIEEIGRMGALTEEHLRTVGFTS